jgi:hypothetical protein
MELPLYIQIEFLELLWDTTGPIMIIVLQVSSFRVISNLFKFPNWIQYWYHQTVQLPWNHPNFMNTHILQKAAILFDLTFNSDYHVWIEFNDLFMLGTVKKRISRSVRTINQIISWLRNPLWMILVSMSVLLLMGKI